MIDKAISTFGHSILLIKQYMSASKDSLAILQEYTRSTRSPVIRNKVKKAVSDLASTRIASYHAKIIGIYGAWERFVEEVIVEYCTYLENNQIKIPFKTCDFAKNYDSLVFSLAGRLDHHKYSEINREELIKSAYRCIVTDTTSLIPDVFFSASGNYDYNNTIECLKRLNISDYQLLKKYQPIKDTLVREFGTGNAVEHIDNDRLFKKWAEVVERRNLASHGADEEIVDDNILNDYIDFMTSVAQSINNLLNINILKLLWKNNSSHYLPSKLNSNLQVLEFENITNIKVQKGDTILIAKQESDKVKEIFQCKVINVRNYEGEDVKSIEVFEPDIVSFSICVDKPLMQNCEVQFKN